MRLSHDFRSIEMFKVLDYRSNAPIPFRNATNFQQCSFLAKLALFINKEWETGGPLYFDIDKRKWKKAKVCKERRMNAPVSGLPKIVKLFGADSYVCNTYLECIVLQKQGDNVQKRIDYWWRPLCIAEHCLATTHKSILAAAWVFLVLKY